MTQPNPDIRHLKWMRGVAIFFILIGGLATVILLFARLFVPSGTFSAGNLTPQIIASVLTLLCGVMAWHASRIAILILLGLILTTFVDLNHLRTFEIALTSVYLVLAVTMLWHAHRYHQVTSKQIKQLRGVAWVRWLGLALATPLAITTIVSVFGGVGTISSKVESARNIPYEQLVWMYDNNLLQSDERVILFYSEGLFSIAEGGNILTNKYVGAWQKDEDGLNDYWQRLGEVCRVETIIEGSPEQDALYKLIGPDEDSWFHILLSVEDDGHKRFLRRMNVMNERRMHPVVKEACDTGEPLDRLELAKANGITQSLVGANNVTDEQKEWLFNRSYLTRDEKIISFYSYGEYDISPGGALLTDTHFGGWYDNGGTIQGNWAKLEEICSLERVDPSDDSDTPMFLMNYGEEDWFRFQLPAEATETLVPSILEQVATRQTDEDKAVCEARSERMKSDAA